MAEFFGALVDGIALGVVYGLLGLAIVLLYKATSVANFAVGSMATFVTFLAFELMQRYSLSLWPALAITMVLSGIVGLAVYVLLMRVNDNVDPMNLTARTVGLYLLLPAAILQLWGQTEPFTFPSIVPTRTLSVAGVRFQLLEVVTIGIVAVFLLILSFGFSRTRTGLLMRGTALRPDVASLLGVSVRRLFALVWILSGIGGLIVGVLIAPTTLLTHDMMDPYLLYAFTAAIVGGIRSFPGTILGGVLVGIVQEVITVYGGQNGADVSLFSLFGVFIVVLIIRPHGLLGQAADSRL